jgi:hypothetical protein
MLFSHSHFFLEYRNYIDALDYTLPVPLDQKGVDIVFVIDRSFYASISITTVCDQIAVCIHINRILQIRQFLTDYVTNFNIGGAFDSSARFAIVGASTVVEPYFQLNDANNISALQALIAQIPTTLSTNPTPDLNRYVLQN